MNEFDKIAITPAFKNLNCSVANTVYKFQPQVLKFSACCHTAPYPFNLEYFENLGADYFEKFPNLINRKQSLLNNIKHHECNTCWKAEERKIISMRMMQGLNSPFVDEFQTKPSRIELWSGSTCNVACFMCNVESSSTYRKIYKDFPIETRRSGIDEQRYIDSFNDPSINKKFKKYISDFIIKRLRTMKPNDNLTIAYLGGEPTLHNEMFEDVDTFIEAGKEAVKFARFLKFQIVTNGTSQPALFNRIMQVYNKYKEAGWKTEVMLSQDAVDQYSQVRYGTNFDRVSSNFNYWVSSDSTVDSVISHTVLSNLNVPYIDLFAEYVKEVVISKNLSKPLNLSFNILNHPKWMEISYLPYNMAVDPVNRAIKIFDELASKFSFFNYNKSLLNNLLNIIPSNLEREDFDFFSSELKKINAIMQLHDSEWDFYKTFPHLNKLENFVK